MSINLQPFFRYSVFLPHPQLTVHVYLDGLFPRRRPGVVGGPAGYRILLRNQ